MELKRGVGLRVFDRYILSEFSRLALITTASFVVVFVLVDLFENIDDLIENDVPTTVIASFFLLKIPFIFCQVSPVAVLLSVLLTLGILSKHSEITAVKAGGVSILRVVSPLFICGILISIMVVVINESVTPATMKQVDAIKRKWLEGTKTAVFGEEGFWLRKGSGIYNVREIDLKSNTLRGLTFYEIKKPFELRSQTRARTVTWQEGGWVAREALRWAFSEDGFLRESRIEGFVFPELEGPEDLLSIEKSYEKMSFTELQSYIEELEREGYNSNKYRVDLYGKLSFPLVNFIMVLLGIPFALKTGRQGGIAAGVGLSVIIGFSFWIVFATSRSLGQNGVLPPLVAAAFPDVLFVAIGVYMFGYVRQ